MKSYLCCFALILGGGWAQAQDALPAWKMSGYAGVMGRVYADTSGQERESARLALRLEPEWSWSDSQTRWVVSPRLFVDGRDSGRDRSDFVELHGALRWDGNQVKVGISRVFWGVTESRHLVDIINPPDLALHYSGDEQRLPTAMVQFSRTMDFGQLEFFALPWERDPRYPGKLGRPNTELPITSDVLHPDGLPPAFAGRVGWSQDKFDAHLYYFRGLDRESVLAPRLQPAAPPTTLEASRKLIRQWGFDLQMPLDNWLLKSEVIYRSGYSRGFFAAVLGAEYAMNSFMGSVADVALMAEYQADPRPGSAPLAPMNHAVFGGIRVALNDPASTEFKLGLLKDAATPAYIWRGDFSRRLQERWTLGGSLNLFRKVAEQPALRAYASDSYLELLLKYHF